METMETQTKVEGGNVEMEKLAGENFALWNEALQTRDAKKVAALYSADATFLPTMSPDFKIGEKEAENYFEHFLLKNPQGKIVEEAVQAMGNDVYLHSGKYDFEIDQEGRRAVVEARFTFAWRKTDDKWKIIHHHSSVKPA